MKHSGLLRSIFSVGALLIIIKLLGFVKQMVLAAAFGATIDTDIINISYSFIGNFQYLLVQVLLTCMVPVYISVREQVPNQAGLFAFKILILISVCLGGIVLLLYLLAPWVSRVLAPSYSPQLIQSLTGYLRLFTPLLLFFSWSALFHALLNANRRFIPGQMEGLYQSVILIFMAIVAAPYLSVDALASGYWIYGVFTALILFLQSRRYLKPVWGNPTRDPCVRSVLRMAVPMMLGYSAIYLNQMVDKMLSSGLNTGTVTGMSYAAVLLNLVGTVTASVCSVLYTYMTEHIAQGRNEIVARLVEKAVLLLTIVMLPVSVITICQSEDIVALVYGRGAFGPKEIQITAAALAGYGFTIVPYTWYEIFTKVQYGYQNSKAPTRNSVIGVTVNIALSILLRNYLGVFGITLASSISSFVMGMLNGVAAKRMLSDLSFTSLARAIPCLFIGGVVSVILCLSSQVWFDSCSVLARLCLTSGIVFAGCGLSTLPLVWRQKVK